MYIIVYYMAVVLFFFFKQKTAYEMRISDWSSDVCSSDLASTHSAAASNPGRIEILRSEADIGGLSCMLDFRLAANLAQPLQFGLRGPGVVVQIALLHHRGVEVHHQARVRAAEESISADCEPPPSRASDTGAGVPPLWAEESVGGRE